MAKKLPADVADRLLDRLCGDDGFRERFHKDPRAALGEIAPAIAQDPNGAWLCLSGEGLPSQEQLRATREALRSRLTTSMSDVIFHVGR